jgi:hypothetical protein
VSAAPIAIAPEPSKGPTVRGWSLYGGINPETSLLRHLLEWHGVVAPHTKAPPTEALVLGIAGGLGGSYWVSQMYGWTSVAIGGRHNPHDVHGKYIENACLRLGLPTDRRESTSTKAGEAALRETLAAGHPGIVWVGMAGMPYFGLPREHAKGSVHTILITGIDDARGTVRICDTSIRSVSATLADLAYARAANTILKNRVMSIRAPAGPVDLGRAILPGIRICVEGLTNQPIRDFGLEAFRQWADLVAKDDDKKGWGHLFSTGDRLLGALIESYESIETKGTGGGLLRPLYAQFLEEAATILKKQALAQAATAYRVAGTLWSKVAAALLPDGHAALKEARLLLLKKAALFREQGDSATTEIKACHARLNALREGEARTPTLTGSTRRDLLREVETRIRVAYEAEVEAVQKLRKAL